MIRRDMFIEDLVEVWPGSVRFLMKRGIRCIVCGAPIWGTLEEALRSHGYGDPEIDGLVAEMRELESAG